MENKNVFMREILLAHVESLSANVLETPALADTEIIS